ncbi:MAG: hypothetical protein R3D32_08435 [Nitratireductor sp.]
MKNRTWVAIFAIAFVASFAIPALSGTDPMSQSNTNPAEVLQ